MKRKRHNERKPWPAEAYQEYTEIERLTRIIISTLKKVSNQGLSGMRNIDDVLTRFRR